MKKYLFLLKSVSLLIILMAFAIILPANKVIKHKIKSEHNAEYVKKQTCSCGIATGLYGSHSGTSVTVQWKSVPGAVNYSLGGYFQCGSGFNYCVSASSGTITFSFYAPANCSTGGTFRVTTNCNGTHCTDATCSGSSSAPASF